MGVHMPRHHPRSLYQTFGNLRSYRLCRRPLLGIAIRQRDLAAPASPPALAFVRQLFLLLTHVGAVVAAQFGCIIEPPAAARVLAGKRPLSVGNRNVTRQARLVAKCFGASLEMTHKCLF